MKVPTYAEIRAAYIAEVDQRWHWRGACARTLKRRASYGGRKGRSAAKRLARTPFRAGGMVEAMADAVAYEARALHEYAARIAIPMGPSPDRYCAPCDVAYAFDDEHKACGQPGGN